MGVAVVGDYGSLRLPTAPYGSLRLPTAPHGSLRLPTADVVGSGHSCGRRRSSPVGLFAGAVRVEGSPLVGWTSLFPLGALQVGGGTGLVEA